MDDDYVEDSIKRGDTYTRSWRIAHKDTGLPLDLSGATARAHLRDKGDTLMVSASTANGKITIDENSGKVFLTFDSSDTAISEGKYYYDIEITLASGYRFSPSTVKLVIKKDFTHD